MCCDQDIRMLGAVRSLLLYRSAYMATVDQVSDRGYPDNLDRQIS